MTTILEVDVQDLRVDVGEIELQIREYERDGEAIIFLHFGGGNLMMWQGVVPNFQNDYRLILVDLRGHGKSDKPKTGYHVDQMARDVVRIMEYLGLSRAHIVGSSLGAEVGLSMAANHPLKVVSLVCEGALYSEYGPYGIWDGSEAEFEENVTHQLAEACKRSHPVFRSNDELLAAKRQDYEKYGWWNKNFKALIEYDSHEISEGAFTYSSWPNWAMEEYLEHYYETRFEDYYKQVKCPVLMLPGEEELLNERINIAMEGLSELLPEVKIEKIPGWVHPYGWLLNPEGVSKVVSEFLIEVQD